MRTLHPTIACLLALATPLFAQPSGTATVEDGEMRIVIPLVTITSGAQPQEAWHWNPLGVEGIQRTWSKDTGLAQIVTVPVDLAVQAVGNAPWQWAAIAAAACLALDVGGSQTWLRDQVMGGSKDADTTEASIPTVQNSGVNVIVNGRDNISVTVSTATSADTTTAEAEKYRLRLRR